MRTDAEAVDLLKDLLSRASLQAGAEGEIAYASNERRSVVWAIGKPHQQSFSSSDGASFRVIKDQRQGMATSNGVNPDDFARIAKTAVEMASYSEPDKHRRLGTPQSNYPAPIPMDNSFFSEPIPVLLERLKGMEEKVLKTDKRLKKVIRMGVTESVSQTGIANTLGVALASKSGTASFVIEILAEDGGQTEVAWDYQSRRFKNELDLEKSVEAVAAQALEALGAASIPSGNYTVLFHPRVGTQLLDLVAESLSAEAVQMNRSFMKGALNKAVASPVVTLIDNPLLPNGVASAPFDDEGTPHQTMEMVSSGTLKTLFYDLRSAARERVEPNGHGIRPSIAGLPTPSATNFYMRPGRARPEDLLASENKVFLIRDVMGLHMADRISGEFSLGASGVLYENGKPKQAVRGVTVAGTVSSVLKSVSMIGNDLTWYGSIGAPSFLVPRMTIAGK